MREFLPDDVRSAVHRAALLALTDGNPLPYDPQEDPASQEQRDRAQEIADAVLVTLFGEESVPTTYGTEWIDNACGLHDTLDTDTAWGVRFHGGSLSFDEPVRLDDDSDDRSSNIIWYASRNEALAAIEESETWRRPVDLVSMRGPVTVHENYRRF